MSGAYVMMHNTFMPSLELKFILGLQKLCQIVPLWSVLAVSQVKQHFWGTLVC